MVLHYTSNVPHSRVALLTVLADQAPVCERFVELACWCHPVEGDVCRGEAGKGTREKDGGPHLGSYRESQHQMQVHIAK